MSKYKTRHSFMPKDEFDIALNMRPECSESECIICPYFCHETGYCSATDEIKRLCLL